MKNQHILFLSILLIAAIFLMTCKKEDKKTMFDGTARIKGTIYFKNLLKGTSDTAKTAALTVKKENADGPDYYTLNLTNGSYDIGGLTGGDYTFSITYIASLSGSSTKITYQQDFPVKIIEDELKINNDLTITESTSAIPILLLQVLDINNSPVKNAQVCLYTDPLTLQKNQNKCVGSYKSAVSNDAGMVAFADLGSATYYATAYSVSGTDTTSNQTTAALTSYGPFTKNATDLKTIKISSDKPALSVTVTDLNGAGIAGAQVCIYSDADLINRYAGKCTGSLKTAVSDQNGTVVFGNMQPISYYISASKIIGNDIVSNLSTNMTPTIKLSASAQNKVTVVIAPEKPTLDVTVTDVNGAYISDAQVCIYSDLGLITKYSYKCTGSLKNGISDQNGGAVFANMQPIAYYISASKVIGKDTLSNIATSLTATAKLTATSPNKVTVVIK